MTPTMTLHHWVASKLERKTCLRAVVLMGTSTLLGCAQMIPDRGHWVEGAEQISRVDRHSSFPAVRRSTFEMINLLELVDPEQSAARRFPAAWAKATNRFDLQYDLALAAFRESAQSPELKRLHRNSVQDRILGVSTSRCNVFKTYLRRQQSDTNFYLGSSATVAGVLGALLPGANASRNLAGVAGILSGVQAEYNGTYYSNLAAHVIVQGIEVHQNRLLNTLITERHNKSINDYSMEAAIRDAVHFDGTCSTVVGLLEASESIKEAVNPGLPRAMQVIGAIKATAEVATASDIKTLVASGEWDRLSKLTQITASPLVVTQIQAAPERALAARLARAQGVKAALNAAVDQAASELATAYEQTVQALSEGERQKVLPPGDLSKNFVTAVNDALAQQLALDACVAALRTSVAGLGQAQFKLLATPADTVERTQAQKEMLSQQGSLDSALTDVETQANEALRVLGLAQDTWALAIKSSRTGLSANYKPDVPLTAPAHLKEACK